MINDQFKFYIKAICHSAILYPHKNQVIHERASEYGIHVLIRT